MPKPMLWAVNALKETLPFFVKGNVLLMGDAVSLSGDFVISRTHAVVALYRLML